MIFDCNVRFIGVTFSVCMYCKLPKNTGTLCFNNRLWFIFIPAFMVWGFVILANLQMQIMINCIMSFLYSVTRITGQPETRWAIVSSHWSHILHLGSTTFFISMVFRSVEALVLCSRDKPFCFSFQTHITKPLMGVYLINISLLNTSWVWAIQRLIFTSLFYLFESFSLNFSFDLFRLYCTSGCLICLVL